jgi:hypothetical protein
MVHDDPRQLDSYGQKLERVASVMHQTVQQAPGNFWFLPGEHNRTAELTQ